VKSYRISYGIPYVNLWSIPFEYPHGILWNNPWHPMEYPMGSYGISCGISYGILWNILPIIIWNLIEYLTTSNGISYEIL
jgi:hypothetical protein